MIHLIGLCLFNNTIFSRNAIVETFEMINRCHEESPHLAAWTDDGKLLVIKDKKAFEREILPLFFKHKNFGSFTRQLNFYGFRRVQVTSKKFASVYFHIYENTFELTCFLLNLGF